MIEQLTERLCELLVNQNREQPNQYRIPNVGDQRNPFTEENDDKDVVIGDEPIFDEEDDGEDEFVAIGDEPIFDEEDENNEECDELLESGDSNIDLVERYQTSKNLGTEITDHPKREYDMPELVENVEYIDFIGINEILYSCIPLTCILKELQVDQELVLFYASKNKFLSQYLGKIRGRIFSTL